MSANSHVIFEKNDDSSSSDSIYPSSEDETSSTELEHYILESNIKAVNARSPRNKKYEKWMNLVLNAKKAMLSSEWSNLLAAIQKLEKAFRSNNTNPLGLFTPILEAKACNATQQRSQHLIRSLNSIILEYQKTPPPITISSSNVRLVDAVSRNTVILGVKNNPLLKSNLHKFQNVKNIYREDVPRLMDICAQAIILKKIPLKRRKLKVFINIQQQIVPDIIINFIKQGFLCESCRLFISPSSSLFLQPIIENMKYPKRQDKILDDQINSIIYQELPLFRRFCVQCWQIHNARDNSKCICVTCKVERATKK
ncbi:11729_t:CDS:2 [Funneliformis caledonium]|uniref:11729_t:CDS:1 n=1 Tax=Funneliformis caledonium TaxID=1117310 RepID=A0A9N9CQL6_9GLOM|nr:11729_t:CDS:2 [Funneliformis caledonium]